MRAYENKRRARKGARLGVVLLVVSSLWPAVPAIAGQPGASCAADHPIDIPDLRLTVSPIRRAYRLGETATVDVGVIREVRGSGETHSLEAEGVTVMVILQSGWRRLAPHGLTDAEGLTSVEVPVKKSLLDEGWVSAYIYAFKEVASTPCGDVREVSNVFEEERFFKVRRAASR